MKVKITVTPWGSLHYASASEAEGGGFISFHIYI